MSKYGYITGPYFPAFSPNTGKYGSEISSVWTLFTQWCHLCCLKNSYSWNDCSWCCFSKSTQFLELAGHYLLRYRTHNAECKKKNSFRISSVNATKAEVNCGFSHIHWRSSECNTSFFERRVLRTLNLQPVSRWLITMENGLIQETEKNP